MAAYCSKADLVERYGVEELAHLTDETAAATPDDSEITKAIDEASSFVDSYISTRYVTPLVSVPTVVRLITAIIARKLLWKDRATDDSVVQRNYNEALGYLRDIAKSTSSLPDSAGLQPPDSGGAVWLATSERVFTDDLLAGM